MFFSFKFYYFTCTSSNYCKRIGTSLISGASGTAAVSGSMPPTSSFLLLFIGYKYWINRSCSLVVFFLALECVLCHQYRWNKLHTPIHVAYQIYSTWSTSILLVSAHEHRPTMQSLVLLRPSCTIMPPWRMECMGHKTNSSTTRYMPPIKKIVLGAPQS